MKTAFFLIALAFAAPAQTTIAIGPAAFSGAGLNDATSGGRYTPAAANAQYLLVQTAAGAPDQFVWSKNGGAASSPVGMTGSPQTLTDGVTITFAASTGHGTYMGTITAATWTSGSGGFANYVTAAPNTLVNGTSLFIAGVSPSGYNTLCVALVYSSTQFSCPLTSNPGTYTSGGMATASGVWSISAQASGSPLTTVAIGPGALVARNGQTKIQEFGASVKDYGAKGDGVTDDTAAFNAAYARASFSPSVFGSVIHVPASPNCYMATRILRRSGVALIGDGPNSTCIKQIYVTGVSENLLDFSYALALGYNSYLPMHDEIVEGLTLDGNRAAQDAGLGWTTGCNGAAGCGAQGSQVIFVYGGERMVMRDLVVKNAATDGIYIVGTGPGTPPTSIGNYLQDIPGHDIVIDNVHVSNSSRNNLSVVCVDGLSISNSSFEGATGQSPQAGIDIEPNYPSQVVDHIHISNSRFTGNAAIGINVALQGPEPNFDLEIASDVVADSFLIGSNVDFSAGTVNVTNGSAAVVGTSTTWNSKIVGATLTVGGITGDSEIVASYTDSTHITLAHNWNGSSAATATYMAAQIITGKVLVSGIYDCTTLSPVPCAIGPVIGLQFTSGLVLTNFSSRSTSQGLYMLDEFNTLISNGTLNGSNGLGSFIDLNLDNFSNGVNVDCTVTFQNHSIINTSVNSRICDGASKSVTYPTALTPTLIQRYSLAGYVYAPSSSDLMITLGTSAMGPNMATNYTDAAALIGGLTNGSLNGAGHICLGTAAGSGVMTKGLCQDGYQNLTAPGTFALTGAFSAGAVSSASSSLATTYMQAPMIGVGVNPTFSPLAGALVSPTATGSGAGITIPTNVVNTGTVTITGGTPTIVTGTGTAWSTDQGILGGNVIVGNENCGTIASVDSTTQVTLSAGGCWWGITNQPYYVIPGYGWGIGSFYSNTNPDLIFNVHGSGGNLRALRLSNVGEGYFLSNVYANGSMLVTAAALSGYAPIASPTFTGTVTAPKLVVTSGSDTFTMDASAGINPNYAVTDGTDIAKLQMITGVRGLVGTQTNAGFGIYTNNTERLDFTAAGAANFLVSLSVGGAAVATQSYVTGLSYATTASLSSYAPLAGAAFTGDVTDLSHAVYATKLGTGINPYFSPWNPSISAPTPASGYAINIPVAVYNAGTVTISGTGATGTGTSWSAATGILNGNMVINNANCGTVNTIGSTTSITLSSATCSGQTGAAYYIVPGYGWALGVSYSSTNPDLFFSVRGAAGNFNALRLSNVGEGYFLSNVYANGSVLATQSYVTGLGYATSGSVASTYAPLASPAFTTSITTPAFRTTTNCASAASPAVCAAAASGAAVVPASATTVVVNTTAVTANSHVEINRNDGLGSRLSVTCDTQSSLVLGTPRLTAIAAGTSFTVSTDVGSTTNPVCFTYDIVN